MNVVVVGQAEGVGEQAAEEHAQRQEVPQVAAVGDEAADEHANGVGHQEAAVQRGQQGVGILRVKGRPVAPGGAAGAVDGALGVRPSRIQCRTVPVEDILDNTEGPPAEVVAGVGEEGQSEDQRSVGGQGAPPTGQQQADGDRASEVIKVHLNVSNKILRERKERQVCDKRERRRINRTEEG